MWWLMQQGVNKAVLKRVKHQQAHENSKPFQEYKYSWQENQTPTGCSDYLRGQAGICQIQFLYLLYFFKGFSTCNFKNQ